MPGHIIEAFYRHPWPGNVRELQNALSRYVTLKTVDFLDSGTRLGGAPAESIGENLNLIMDAYERKIIMDALEKTRWQKIKAAEQLGIHRKTLFMKLKKYGIK
jgi:DNA-binding NtrC family response regulator